MLGQNSTTPNPSASGGPHLYGERVTLPLIVVKGYPFLEGSINGKKGKLLFDVADVRAFDLDDHTVTQAGGIASGHGSFGSGQTFDTMSYPVVDELTLGAGLHFSKMSNIRGSPGLPLEQNITPDFIGWIGVDFWNGYVFKLDYQKPSVAFYLDDNKREGERAAFAGETLVQKQLAATLRKASAVGTSRIARWVELPSRRGFAAEGRVPSDRFATLTVIAPG